MLSSAHYELRMIPRERERKLNPIPVFVYYDVPLFIRYNVLPSFERRAREGAVIERIPIDGKTKKRHGREPEHWRRERSGMKDER